MVVVVVVAVERWRLWEICRDCRRCGDADVGGGGLAVVAVALW